MNTLQSQIKELEDKIEKLRELVERIGEQVTTLVKDKPQVPGAYSLSSRNSRNNLLSEDSDHAYSLNHHKDIIMDDNSGNSFGFSSNDQELSTEIQIRRLTAQLTAAYNRIAALEEQLLTYRIKS